MYKKYVNKNKDPEIFDRVKCLQNELDSAIESNTTPAYQKSSLIQ